MQPHFTVQGCPPPPAQVGILLGGTRFQESRQVLVCEYGGDGGAIVIIALTIPFIIVDAVMIGIALGSGVGKFFSCWCSLKAACKVALLVQLDTELAAACISLHTGQVSFSSVLVLT